MKYPFDETINRRNSDSIKWDVKENELPMWVADMDFSVAPEIREALQERLSHPCYGYTAPQEDWYEAYISFFEEMHHFQMEKEELLFCTGVVPTISSTVRKLTKEGDHVVVLSPVYNIFYNSIINNNRVIHEVPLLYKNGEYEIDFENLEKAFALKETTLCIFCNPANPVSKIWSKEELERVGKLAYEHGVVVLSDEIHCEIVRPGKEYIPFASVNDINKNNCIMAIAPTKTFNLAGIQTSAIYIPNEELRKKVNRQINTDEVAEPNIFACHAAVAAFNHGREWLKEMREYVFANRDFLEEFVQEQIPNLSVVKGDATYLVWVDISKVSTDSKAFSAFLREKTGLFVSSGHVYGGNGNQFIRINVACNRKTLIDGLTRLKEGVELYLKEKN